MLSSAEIARIDWAKSDGLVPVVVQCRATRAVLMLGYMNSAALTHTLECGHVTFYSRSKARLWTKGESTGHFLTLVDIYLDCDADTLLILATPAGPTCHVGTQSCFGDGYTETAAPTQSSFLSTLDELIAERKRLRPAGSYTTKLFDGELRRIAQKVGEEGVETALAAVAQDNTALLGESADLLYHLLVLLHAKDLDLTALEQTLAQRHG